MDINSFKDSFDKTIDFLQNDISGLRTGRASVAIVEDLTVEAYGAKQPLKSLASIAVPDAKTVTVEPWDKSVLADLEKSIRDSDLGINPVNNGQAIILAMPELTTERRQELSKVLHQKLENARVSIRKIREEAKEKVVQAESSKEITEDDRYRLQDELDKMVKDFNNKVKEIGEEKEKEINSV